MDVINYVVVGLGLNVNTSSFPVPLREKATSVLLETGKPFPRVRLLRDFLKWFERYYELLNKDGFQPILRRWKSLTQMIGHQIQVRVLDEEYRGKVLDVDMSGALILEGDDGKSQRIFSGDVTLI
jgi:BirA family biotin operon repressor/biotin-[acetyl-CoA-carboxylase] ligase